MVYWNRAAAGGGASNWRITIVQHSPYENARPCRRNSIGDAVNPPNTDVAAAVVAEVAITADDVDAPASSAIPSEISVATISVTHIFIHALAYTSLGDLGSDQDAKTANLLLFVETWLSVHFGLEINRIEVRFPNIK